MTDYLTFFKKERDYAKYMFTKKINLWISDHLVHFFKKQNKTYKSFNAMLVHPSKTQSWLHKKYLGAKSQADSLNNIK